MEKEIWKDIKEFESCYQISNAGKVKSLPRKIIRKNGISFTTKEMILKPYIAVGYYYIVLYKNSKAARRVAIHRLVAETFLGLNKEKNYVNHKDHNPLNNNLDNLEWTTNKENTRFCIKTKKSKTSSIYKGVSWVKRNNKWTAGIMVNYKRIGLGYFKLEKDAAIAYNIAAKKYFKEFALLNKF